MVLAGILINLFGSGGIINQILGAFGLASVSPIAGAQSFRPFIWISNIWKEVGWDSIIYIAAIASIDPGLYEAAEVDGASRLQRIWHITLPGIRSTIAIMLILAVGQVMTNGSFDQIFNLYSPSVYAVGDTLDTYIFRESFITGGLNFGYSDRNRTVQICNRNHHDHHCKQNGYGNGREWTVLGGEHEKESYI